MTDSSRAPAPRPRRKADLRASHADREAVAEQLREAAGDGRIDLEELEERLDRAFQAKTYGELEPLTADLPSSNQPLPSKLTEQKPLVLKTGAGDIVQGGPWVVPARIDATSRLGDIKIDFSRAECRHHEVVLAVRAGLGNVTVIVPHGWSVRTHRLKVSVGTLRNRATDPPSPDSPTIELIGRASVGDVRIRYPNRWEQWLRD